MTILGDRGTHDTWFKFRFPMAFAFRGEFKTMYKFQNFMGDTFYVGWKDDFAYIYQSLESIGKRIYKEIYREKKECFKDQKEARSFFSNKWHRGSYENPIFYNLKGD